MKKGVIIIVVAAIVVTREREIIIEKEEVLVKVSKIKQLAGYAIEAIIAVS